MLHDLRSGGRLRLDEGKQIVQRRCGAFIYPKGAELLEMLRRGAADGDA